MKMSRVTAFAGAGVAAIALMVMPAQSANAAPAAKSIASCKNTAACKTSKLAVPKVKSVPSSATIANNKNLDRYAGYLVEDVATADEWTADGIAANLALATLGKTLAGIAAMDAPAGADPATFFALASTSSDFAYAASDDYSYGDDMQGLARYTVVRSHLQELLNMINAGVGTSHTIPA